MAFSLYYKRVLSYSCSRYVRLYVRGDLITSRLASVCSFRRKAKFPSQSSAATALIIKATTLSRCKVIRCFDCLECQRDVIPPHGAPPRVAPPQPDAETCSEPHTWRRSRWRRAAAGGNSGSACGAGGGGGRAVTVEVTVELTVTVTSVGVAMGVSIEVAVACNRILQLATT